MINKKMRHDKRGESFFRRHRVLLAFFILVLLLVLTFGGYQLFLYIRFIIGNDIVVQLQTPQKDYIVKNGEYMNVSFDINSISGPLCSMECNYIFLNIGENSTISESNFSIIQGATHNAFFTLLVNGLGESLELYQFRVSCHNKKSLFCRTDELPMTRTELITVQRKLNDSDFSSKESSKNALENISYLLVQKKAELFTLKNAIAAFNGSIGAVTMDNINPLISNFSGFNQYFESIQKEWDTQQYEKLALSTNMLNNSFENWSKQVGVLFDGFNKTVLRYNSWIKLLTFYRDQLNNLTMKNYTSADAIFVQSLIADFNGNVLEFNKTTDLSKKSEIIKRISSNNLSSYSFNMSGDVSFGIEGRAIMDIPLFSISPYNAKIENQSFIFFNESAGLCCVLGNCTSCCRNCNKLQYPVIFLHGHDFGKSTSAEKSVNVFDSFQQSLQSDGYISAGEIYSSYKRADDYGSLRMIPASLSFRATYYMDSFKSSGGYVPVQTKDENIDTYAIRLRDIIQEVQSETGKNKIIIIAHSMGGLVARRYIQIFGNAGVDRLVMIGTPNEGIEGSTTSLCGLFGARLECRDLTVDSLFLNKLNNEPSDSVPTLNIIGIGCKTNGVDGDGVVREDNAFLQNAENVYINGSCTGVDVLHMALPDVKKYPGVYDIVKEFIVR